MKSNFVSLCFIIVVLLLITTTLPCHATNSNSCPIHFTFDLRVDRMVYSVDITRFDPHDVFNIHTFKHILEFTCDSNVTWSSEHIPNQTYIVPVPDQVYHVYPPEEGEVIKDLGMYAPKVTFGHSMYDVRNIMLNYNNKLTTMTTRERAGACSRNPEYIGDYLRKHFRENVSFAFGTSTVPLYSIELKPPSDLILNSDFAKAVAILPVKHKQNSSEIYQQFVAQYGTHYIERATFGCYIHRKFIIPHKYMQSLGEAEIEDILKTSYYLWVKNASSNTEWMNVSKPRNYDAFCNSSVLDCNWHEKYDDYANVFGPGNVCPNYPQHNQDNIDNAIHDLYTRPFLIELFLRPLEDLISNPSVRAHVKLASEKYRIGGYLDELKAVYDAAKLYYQPSDENQLAVKKVEAFVSNSNISSSINAEQAIQLIDDMYSKVKDKPYLDQQITDSYVTASLKLQLAHSICDRSAGLCPSSAIVQENDQLEQLYHEYESSKANAEHFTREMYHEFGRKVRVLSARHHIQVELKRGLGASCDKCGDN